MFAAYNELPIRAASIPAYQTEAIDTLLVGGMRKSSITELRQTLDLFGVQEVSRMMEMLAAIPEHDLQGWIENAENSIYGATIDPTSLDLIVQYLNDTTSFAQSPATTTSNHSYSSADSPIYLASSPPSSASSPVECKAKRTPAPSRKRQMCYYDACDKRICFRDMERSWQRFGCFATHLNKFHLGSYHLNEEGMDGWYGCCEKLFRTQREVEVELPKHVWDFHMRAVEVDAGSSWEEQRI
ncbi:hypothetical protein T440DRAFT_516302 [Plenodomus tracheiphilus IPT5]|uniref:Uncharacterized protein n=1 Tax=Plenodomus tracheiphilus IPT5 TaxID=1408161 RepID=A0A6A7BA88_9PLEO|nr:hypothetical protein T440DRAFT_516302 [Plenodomus tracheiphilus IPT5]